MPKECFQFPRFALKAIPAELSPAELLSLAKSNMFKTLTVYLKNVDNILNVKIPEINIF